MPLSPPMITYESALWRRGIRCLAGVDEVGRGALAGPLVSAAVAWENRQYLRALLRDRRCVLIRDSKTLSHGQRVEARSLIDAYGAEVSVGVVSAEEIDNLGLAAANRIAMERAVHGLVLDPGFLLIDAMVIDHDACQWGIINGDAQSLLISAASIAAKVARDDIMEGMEVRYRTFSFSRHRGYGTALHLEELAQAGPCDIHRQSFEPVRSFLSAQS